MPVPSANRATIAGLGTTAALLAAIVAVSLVVGGLVAYSGSPGGPLVSREPRLALPGSAADAAGQAARKRAPLTLPATRPAPAAATPAATPDAASGDRPADDTTPAPVTSTAPAPDDGAASAPVDAPPANGAPPVTPAPSVVPGGPTLPLPTDELAATTTTTGQSLGGSLRQTLGAVGAIVTPDSPSLGQTVDGLGAGLGGTVTQSTDGLAAVLRRLGG